MDEQNRPVAEEATENERQWQWMDYNQIMVDSKWSGILLSDWHNLF